MVAALAILQLPLLVLTGTVASGALFGHDGGSAAGRMTAGFLLALVPLSAAFQRVSSRLAPAKAGIVLGATCLVIASWAYGPLHLGRWDELAADQSVRLGLLGVVSLLLAHHGAARAAAEGGPSAEALAKAFVVLGVLWLPVLLFPFWWVFAAGLCGAVVLAFPGHAPQRRSDARGRLGVALSLALALGALEISLPVWDLAQDTRWAALLAWSFVGVAFGASTAPRLGKHATRLGALLLVVVAAAEALSDAFALHPLHALGAGVATGWILAAAVERPRALFDSTLPWVLGFGLALPFALNLAIVDLRLVLLVALVGVARSPRRVHAH